MEEPEKISTPGVFGRHSGGSNSE